ncbi:DNA-binding response regulator [Geomonas silvestris]|uniref:DNA-binding response regulator n=1 Tax=Geomonas silvestris TaxID=2740184 RepID=A0A6V8MME6_9BACT|nr:LytTR family DNA-binding domain-containing protein [Geomonas silvestris]GFO61150.1 DNA-binding response regulator [Geomonas silvestris]
MSITTYLIDDEAPTRRELRFLLEELGEVTILGEAGTPSQGLQGIRECRPQLIFLDIQMPGLSGIELAEIIRALPEPPLIVFATAYEGFAVEAFNVEALDYLLKPLTLERVARAVRKAAALLRLRAALAPVHEASEPALGADKGEVKRVLVHQGDKLIPIAPEQIVFIRALEGEAEVHTADGVFFAKSTLTTLEAILEPYSFVRVHRNSLVNLSRIIEIIPWFNGSCKLVLNDRQKSEVLVSRYHAKDLKQRLILSS